MSLLLPPAAPAHQSRVAFPVCAAVLGVLGIFALTAADANIPTTPATLWPLLLRGGGASVGIAVAFTLTAHPRRRLLLAPLLAAIIAAVADLHTATLIGVLLTTAITFWWAGKAARLALAHPAIAGAVRTVSATTTAAPDPAGPGLPGAVAAGLSPTTTGPTVASRDSGPESPAASTTPAPARPEPRRFVDQPWAATRDD